MVKVLKQDYPGKKTKYVSSVGLCTGVHRAMREEEMAFWWESLH